MTCANPKAESRKAESRNGSRTGAADRGCVGPPTSRSSLRCSNTARTLKSQTLDRGCVGPPTSRSSRKPGILLEFSNPNPGPRLCRSSDQPQQPEIQQYCSNSQIQTPDRGCVGPPT